jgi:hypothetical protein
MGNVNHALAAVDAAIDLMARSPREKALRRLETMTRDLPPKLVALADSCIVLARANPDSAVALMRTQARKLNDHVKKLDGVGGAAAWAAMKEDGLNVFDLADAADSFAICADQLGVA